MDELKLITFAVLFEKKFRSLLDVVGVDVDDDLRVVGRKTVRSCEVKLKADCTVWTTRVASTEIQSVTGLTHFLLKTLVVQQKTELINQYFVRLDYLVNDTACMRDLAMVVLF